ncbi:TPA: hypothetical protein ACKP5W_006153, partial [Pseudomonas aeruginosa]
KLGRAYLAKAGREIHLKAGQKMVIEADSELTVKAGGSFIRLDASGIAISGPLARINAGGAPVSGSGIAIKMPSLPGAADSDVPGATPLFTLANDCPEKPGEPPAICEDCLKQARAAQQAVVPR